MQRRGVLALGAAAALPLAHAAAGPLRRIGFVSCIHQERPQALVDFLAEQAFDLFLFGGDNVYAPRPYGRDKLRAAYDKAAAAPGYTRLRRKQPHMAVWDDNDYDSADGGASFAFRQEAREEFLAFWQVQSQDPRRSQEGLYHAQTFGPPGQRVQVIVLDTRSFRSRILRDTVRLPGDGGYTPDPDPAKTMLGAAQWQWLEAQLRQPAEVRLLVSSIQVLAEGHRWERWGNLPAERERLVRTAERIGRRIAQRGSVPDQLARCFQLRGTFGQPKTHRLVVEDGLPKTLALFGIVQRHLKGAARHANALRRNADAPAFQRAQGDLVTLTLLTNQILRRDTAVVKVDLRRVAGVLTQLVFQARHHIPRGSGWHQERAHAFFASRFVGDGNDDGHVAVLAAGDELLDTLDDVAVTVLHRGGTQRRCVRPHMRLGQAKSPQHLTLSQRGEPLLLLLRIAVAHQDGVDRAIGDGNRGTGAAVARGDFLQHQGQRHIVQPRAAQGLGHTDAVGPQRSQALVRLFREMVFLVPACRMRPQLTLGKITHRVADHLLVLGQQHGVTSPASNP